MLPVAPPASAMPLKLELPLLPPAAYVLPAGTGAFGPEVGGATGPLSKPLGCVSVSV